MSKIKYVLCPDYVVSRHDGERHFITADMLIRLYEVNPRHCVRKPDGDNIRGWTAPNGAIYLYPRNDGNYSIPNQPKERK